QALSEQLGQGVQVSAQASLTLRAISPTSQSFTAAGGMGSVNVTAAMGCSWSAGSNTTWIMITSGASGSGNGTVGYSVVANEDLIPRMGTITIAGQIFTVN